MTPEPSFWQTFTELVSTNPIILNRLQGSSHPRYPELIYPIDYGYLKNTSAGEAMPWK
ncbi:MAG: hypothetical protein ABI621_06755 [Chloroflexota bacterium]